MNKYNVRAIRTELDQFIRNNSWKKFRAKFQALKQNSDLCQAVVDYRPQHKKKSTKSLLHVLCHCVHAMPPVPIDLLESISLECPHLLYQCPSPLSIALDRQASPCVVECLLIHDETKQSLYMQNSKGETPILQAVRQESSAQVTSLLMKHDRTKQSLLMASKKKDRVPLYYVAHQELPVSYLSDTINNMDELLPLSEELQCILSQTYQAVEIEQGRRVPMLSTSEEEQERRSYLDIRNEDDWDTREGVLLMYDLLRATIGCAHFLGEKNTTKLLHMLEPRADDAVFETCDSDGNTILHHLCHAQETGAFLELNWSFSEEGGDDVPTNFLEYLIALHPEAGWVANDQGWFPIHLAIQTNKGREFLQHLSTTLPWSIRTGRQLALHLAIEHYPNPSSNEVMQLWRRYPEACSIADSQTQLFAFQLAACKRTCHHSSFGGSSTATDPPTITSQSKNKETPEARPTVPVEDTAELDQLSAIFFFLRASPHVLQQFL